MAVWTMIAPGYFVADAETLDMDEREIPPAPKPGPEVCAECHNTIRVDPQAAWDAVVAMCK